MKSTKIDRNQLITLFKELKVCYDLDEAEIYLKETSVFKDINTTETCYKNKNVLRVLRIGELSMGSVYAEADFADGTSGHIELSSISKLILTRNTSACGIVGSTVDLEYIVTD